MTNKLFFPLCFTSAVALAACVSYEPVAPAPQAAVVSTAPVLVAPAQQVIVPGGYAQGAYVVQTQPGVVIQSAPLRTGYATVRGLTPLSDGATRVTLAMNDNTTQLVDTRAANLYVGATVEITNEGFIRYPIAPQANRSRY
jgi:hypothetical protein